MKSFSSRLTAIIAAAALIALDQWTKILAVSALGDGHIIPIIRNVLVLMYIENRGAAFGIFQNGTVILSVISAIAVAAFVVFYQKIPPETKYRPIRIILVFLTAGAAGNLIDRVMLHYVRDFIYFQLIDFPVFNVADIYVTCSVFVLVILLLFVYKEDDLEKILK